MTKFKKRRQEAELRKKYGIRTNRKAGMHAKKGDGLHLAKKPGLKRIKKRRVDVTRVGFKPANVQSLTFKHKRRLIKVLAVVAVVAIAAVAVLAMGFWKKDASILRDLGFDTIRLTYPEDGTTPANYMSDSGDEKLDREAALANVGYMHDRFKRQPFWESYYHGVVSTIATQDVKTWKHYDDGVLVSADITTSSLINNARQFCVANGRVLWRNAADYRNPGTYKGMDTPWANSLQGNLPIDSTVNPETGESNNDGYKVRRGLPHDAFCVYIINEDTLLDASPVTVNADGTYSQTYKLNPATYPSSSEFDEKQKNSAAYYYKQQMKVTGDLDELPTFKSISVTFTFDDTWQLLRSDLSEAYSAKFMVTADCTCSSYTVYNYDRAGDPVDPATGKAQSCDTDAYDQYFRSRFDEIADSKEELGALDYITKAFAPVMEGQANLDVDIKLGGTSVNGKVFTDIPNGKALVKLGNLFVEYGDGPAGQSVFVKYGDVKISLPIDELGDLAATFTGGDNGGAAVISRAAAIAEEDGGSSGFDINSLTEGIGKAKVTLNEDGSKALINAEILGLPIEFSVSIDGDGSVKLDYVSLVTQLAGEDVDLHLSYSKGSAGLKELTEAEKREYTSLISMVGPVAELTELVNAPALAFNIGYNSDGATVNGDIRLAIKPAVIVTGDIAVTVNGTQYSFSFGYDDTDKLAYISACKDGDEDGALKLRADVNEIAELVGSLMRDYGDGLAALVETLPDFGGGININVVKLIAAVIADDDFAKNLTFNYHGDEGLTFGVKDINLLLAAAGVDVGNDLGGLTLNVNGGASLDILGLSLKVEAADVAPQLPRDEIADYGDALDLIHKIENVIRDGGLSITGDVELTSPAEVEITLKRLDIDWSDGFAFNAEAEIRYGKKAHNIAARLADGALSLAYNGTAFRFDVTDGDNDLRTFDGALTALYNAITESGLLEKLLPADVIEQIPDLSGGVEQAVKDIIKSVKGAIGDADGAVGSLAEKLGGADKADLAKLIDILSGLRVEVSGGNITGVGFEGFGLKLGLSDESAEENGWLGVSVSYDGGDVKLDGLNVHILTFADKEQFTDRFDSFAATFAGAADGGNLARITSYLADSLVPLITGKANLGAELKLGSAELKGRITTDLPEAALYADLGNLFAELSDGNIYLNYGDNASIKVPASVDYIKSLIGKFTELKPVDIDIDALVKGLAAATIDERNGKAFASLDILGVPVTVSFNLGEKATLDTIGLSLQLGETDIEVKLTYLEEAEEVQPLDAEVKASATALESLDAELNVIAGFIKAKAIEFSLNLAGDKFSLGGEVTLGLDPLVAEADLTLSIDGAANKALYIAYDGSDVYIAIADCDNLKADGSAKNAESAMKVRTDLKSAYSLILGLINPDGEGANDEAAELLAENTQNKNGFDIDLFGFLGSALNDKSFANNISVNGDGGLNVAIENADALLKALGVDLSGVITAGRLSLGVKADGNAALSLGLGSLTLEIGAAAGDTLPVIDKGENYKNFEDIYPVIEKICKIVKEGALTAEVNLGVSVDGENRTDISLAVDRLDVSWKDGVKVNAAINIGLNGKGQSVYVQFVKDRIYVVYGGVAIALDWAEKEEVDGVKPLNDIEKIDAAAVALYDRLRKEIIPKMLTDQSKNPLPDVGTSVGDELAAGVNKIVEYVKQLMTAADAANELSSLIPSGGEGGGFKVDTILDIVAKLGFLNPTIADGGFIRVVYDGLTAEISDGADGALAVNLSFEKSGVKIDLDSARVWAFDDADKVAAQFAGFDLSELEGVDYITGDTVAEMLDFVGSALEISVQQKFELSLSGVNTSLEKATVTNADGTVSETDELAYQNGYETADGVKYENVKYVLEGNLAYDVGNGGYPLHFLFGEDENGKTRFNDLENFWISPALKTSIRVQLAAMDESRDSSFFLEGHVLDYGSDGELDIFLTISTYADWDQMSSKPTNYKDMSQYRKPLKIHAPSSELMTIVAIVAEVLDVDIDFVENLLIDKWIGASRYQFAALGESLVGTLDLGGLNGVINNVNELFAMLGGSNDLGGFISALLGKFKNDGAAESSPASTIALSGEKYDNFSYDGFIKSADFEKIDPKTGEAGEGGTKATLTFDKGSIYDGNVNAEKDIEFTATKYDNVYGENGEITEYSRLKNVGLHNVYFNNCLEMLNLDIGVNYDSQFEFVEPVYSDYMSLQGVDVLLESLVNSATHKTGETEIDGAQVPVYDVNDSFYISGSVDISVINIVNINIGIEGLDVIITDDFEVYFNGRLHMDKSIAIDEETVVDISLKDGRLYLKRTIKNEEVYRVYTLSALNDTDKILDLVYFITNLKSGLQSTINSAVKDSGGGETTTTSTERQDLGAMLDTYIKSLSTNDKADGYGWTMVLNGNSLMSALSDVTVTLNANSDGKDAYVIDSLDASLALASVVKINAKLNYLNPKGVLSVPNVTDGNLPFELAEGLKDELAVTDWNVTTYIEGAKTYIDYVIMGSIVDRQPVIYNTSTNMSYSGLTLPDESKYRIAGYSFRWDVEGSNVKLVGGKVQVCADMAVNGLYTGNTYRITLVSDSEVTADGWRADEGKWKYTFDYIFGTEFNLPEVSDIQKYVSGWKLNGKAVDKETVLNEISALEDGADVTLEAVWSDVEYTVTYEYNGKTATQEGVYGDELNFPTDTEKTGYEFAGWNTEDTTISGNVTYTAQYTPCKYTITVESEYEISGIDFAFDSEEYKDGKWYYTFTYEYDSFIVLPSSIIITDDSGTRHHLDGFAFDAAGAVSNNMQNVTAPATMYAKWSVVQSIITFTSTETGVSYTQNYNDGDRLSNLPEVPARAHYTGEWDIDENYTVHGDDTIYAKYTPITYTVRAISYQPVDGYGHDEANGYYYKEYRFTYGGAVVELDKTVDIAKFDFGGYFMQADGAGEEVKEINDAFIEGGNTEVYIKWIDNTVRVKLRSDVYIDGFSADIVSNSFYCDKVFNDDYALPDVSLLVEGYQQLGGWWYSPDGGEKWDCVDDVRNLDGAELWAIWIQDVTVEITEFSKSWGTYTIGGVTYGGRVFGTQGGHKISEKIGLEQTTAGVYNIFYNDGKRDTLKNGKGITINYDEAGKGTFRNSGMTSFNALIGGGADFGGIVLTITYKYTDSHDSKHEIKTTNGSIISMKTYKLTFHDPYQNKDLLVISDVHASPRYEAEGPDGMFTCVPKTFADYAPALPVREGYTASWDTDMTTALPTQDTVINVVYTPNASVIDLYNDDERSAYTVKVGENKINFPAAEGKELYPSEVAANSVGLQAASNA